MPQNATATRPLLLVAETVAQDLRKVHVGLGLS